MKNIILAVTVFISGYCMAGDADELYQQGLDALRAGQIVPAAKLLAEASEKYEAAGNDAAASDSASALFWCRKKMTLQDVSALHQADEKIAARADAVVSRKVEPSNAEKALQKANSFAAAHQDDQLLVAVHYFEVGSLYRGTDASFKAIDLSLAAMGKVKSEVRSEPAKAKPVVTLKPLAGSSTQAAAVFDETTGFTTSTLSDGAVFHHNYDSKFTQIPKELEGKTYTLATAFQSAEVSVALGSSGIVYVMLQHWDPQSCRQNIAFLQKQHGKKEAMKAATNLGTLEVWSISGVAGTKFVFPAQVTLVADKLVKGTIK